MMIEDDDDDDDDDECKSSMKPGKEPHAAGEPRVGHP